MRRISRILLKREVKQFLKPTIGKVGIIVIILAAVVVCGLNYPKVVFCIFPSCPQSMWVMFPWKFCPTCGIEASDILIGTAYYAAFPLSVFENASNDVLMSYLILITQAAYWYIVSCMTIWNYRKIKKNYGASNHRIHS
ncbi:MAG: hypothetical protein V1678_02835 [Candidatus Aenigmatarchaeota archaeon]